MQPADDATVARSPEETPTVVVAATVPVATPQHRQLTPGSIVGGRYRIVSMLGRGGMGEVYRADDLRMGQPVALKFLSARLASERGRLYDEVRMGRQIAHPNVCRVYDVSEIDGDAFITMEFVDGEDLASLIRRIGRLSATKAISLAREITSGLAAAHEKGVVHRDLKPANVMVDDRGRARITDFGLAVAEDGVQARSLAGTPAYMAPEQLDGQPATPRSDIYALGLVLYEVFTGRRAFAAESITQLVEAQRTARYTRVTAIAPDVPPEVELLIAHCLDFDAAKRPTAEALLREFPSFDALAAAVAAGETPAPDVVAGANDRDAVSVPLVTIALALFLVAVTACVLMSRSTMLYARQARISPDVLADRAGEFVRSVSRAPAIDSLYGYVRWRDELLWRYRQSPSPMRSRTFSNAVLFSDPPETVPGMASVTLDASGALTQLTVVPPSSEFALQTGPSDFGALLASAHIARGGLQPTYPERAAPVDTDEKHAWLAPADRDRRIEVAAYHGRPVWFQIFDNPNLVAPPSRLEVSTRQLSQSMLFTFIGVLSVVALLIARRNMRRGTGDARSALRLAVFVFVTLAVGTAAHAHHPPAFLEEVGTLTQIVVDSVFVAAMTGIAYIAIEPLMRRRWPRTLIGSTRLLSGTWRDRIVGRDLLAGAAAGAAIMVATNVTALLRGAAPLYFSATALGQPQQVLYVLVYHLAEGIIRSIAAVTLVVAIRALIRNEALTIVVAATLIAVSSLSDSAGGWAPRIAVAALTAIVIMTVLFRFGVLALSVAAYVVLILRYMPLTFDSSVWYFGRSLLALAILTTIAIAGFILALGDRASLHLALDD